MLPRCRRVEMLAADYWPRPSGRRRRRRRSQRALQRQQQLAPQQQQQEGRRIANLLLRLRRKRAFPTGAWLLLLFTER